MSQHLIFKLFIVTMKQLLNKNIEDVCSFCQQQPQDMLILSCRHNLCLQCATQVYNMNSKEDKLTCQICLSQTKLGNETILCLRSLIAKNLQKKPCKIRKSLLNQNDFPINIIPKQHKQSNLQLHHSKRMTEIEEQFLSAVDIICTKHHDKIVYFCFDCNNYKICSECMLSQNHRDHKVLTLKKATQHIRQNINMINRQKVKLKKLLEKDCQNLINRKQNSQKQYEINQNDMKTTFDQLITMIQEKYQEQKIFISESARRKLQIMQGAIAQISQKIDLISKTIQFQDQLILQSINQVKSKEKYRIFEYYSNELNRPIINFQPNLPNFISEVHQQILNKNQIFDNIKNLLQQFKFIQQEDQQNYDNINQSDYDNINKQNYDNINQQNYDNINRMSLIYNDQVHNNFKDLIYDYPKIMYQNTFKIKQKLQISSIQPQKKNRLVSSKLNIIQQNLCKKNVIQNTKINLLNNKMSLSKRQISKQSIQIQKNKTKNHLRNKQLTNSRKKELSQSIINANDIINKIQQRSFKI